MFFDIACVSKLVYLSLLSFFFLLIQSFYSDFLLVFSLCDCEWLNLLRITISTVGVSARARTGKMEKPTQMMHSNIIN